MPAAQPPIIAAPFMCRMTSKRHVDWMEVRFSDLSKQMKKDIQEMG